MPILPIVAALAMGTATHPADFTAQCTDDRTTTAWFKRGNPSHPVIRQTVPAPPGPAPSGTIMIPGYVPAHGYSLVLSHRNGEYSIEVRGPDFDVIQANGPEFKVDVLKAASGDVVLSVQTSKWGTSFAVYHLRYAGVAGALTVTTTRYGGRGDDSTSMTVMTCKIGDPSIP